MNKIISTLRQAGFFKNYQNLSESELLDTLYEIEKQYHVQLLGGSYFPERKTDAYSIATQDNQKFLDIDLEADVCASNKVYTSLLSEFAQASNGFFRPIGIEEVWHSEQEPISLSFESNAQTIVFEPKYEDDWIDSGIFELINVEMRKVSNEFFYVCSGPNDEWLGQNAIYIRLTESEKALLAAELKWNFHDSMRLFKPQFLDY